MLVRIKQGDEGNDVIEEALREWDGKSFDGIDAVHGRFHDDPRYIPEILTLTEVQELQKGTTWLLKKYVETGGVLTQEQITAVYRLLPTFDNWEAKLHILQIMPQMPIPDSHHKSIADFLRECTGSDKKFVRAWAYNGFYELAKQYPQFQAEVTQLLDAAMADEAASVKARIRNILKQGW